MTARTGMTQRIAAYVAAYPGCTRAELIAGCGIAEANSHLPSYCARHGMIHASGRRGTQRYYATAELAAANHRRHVAEAEERERLRRMRDHKLRNLRLRAKRQAAGQRLVNTRPGRHLVQLDPGVTLAPDVRITIAPPPRDRWAA
jgi:hypothetical protein